MRKAIVGRLFLAGCSALLLCAGPGCKATLYPAARAFGSPPESEFSSCRVHLREMQSSLPKATLTAHPPCVITRSATR